MIYSSKVGDVVVAATIFQREISVRSDAMAVMFEDSIHRYYNRAFLDLQDSDSVLKEAYLHANGILVDVSLGKYESKVVPELTCSGKFVNNTTAYEVSLQKKNSTDQGLLRFDLVNSLLTRQPVHHRIHKGRISEIITKLCQEDGFITKGDKQNAFIDECGNDDTWHQDGMTNAEFIERVLVPNAYGALDLNPYFAWIDSKGNFHFRNLLFMLGNHGVAKGELHLKLAFDAESSNHTKEVQLPKTFTSSNTTNPLIEIREWKKLPVPFAKQLKGLSKKHIILDWRTGSVDEQDDLFPVYPLNMSAKGFTHRPFGVPVDPQYCGGVEFGMVHTVSGINFNTAAGCEFENHIGRRISSMWQDLLCDRYECSTPFFPNLLAGTAVIVGTMWKMAAELKSITHTGLFLVEASRHGWDSIKQEPYSVLTLARYGLEIDPTKIPALPHLNFSTNTKISSNDASDANRNVRK